MDNKDCEYSKLDTNRTKDRIEHEDISESKKDEQSIKNSISYLQLFKFSTTCDKIFLLIAALLSFASGVCISICSIICGKLVDAVITYALVLSNSIDDNEKIEALDVFMNAMNIFAIAGGLAAVIIFGTTYISMTIFNYTAIRQTFKIRELYLYQVLNQDISWHDQNATGDFAIRISDNLHKVQDGIGDKACIFIQQVGISLAGIVQSFFYGWELTLICIIPFPVSLIILGFIGKITAKLSKEESDVNGEAGSVVEEALSCIKTVVAFDGQAKEAKKYDYLISAAMKFNIKRYFFIGLGNGLLDLISFGGNALAVWYGIMLVIKGREGNGNYKVENIITIFTSTVNSIFYIKLTIPYIELFNLAKGAAHKIFSVIDDSFQINKSYNVGAKFNNIDGKIVFDNVYFNYPARNTVQILKGLNLFIKPKETIALVGSSGCGKSTIIQLIQRFYDPVQGIVYVDNLNVKTLNLNFLRSHIGVVSQEPVLFDVSIFENIKLGNLNASQKDVEEAAKKSNAHSFITSLPNGYNTVIGERGTQLSGGQKQRIAIARALIRNPAILLLDEATSALDSKSESTVQAALETAAYNCTTIIVAHRLSTVRKADRIIVLDNGKVIEEGSHNDLILKQGFYHKLVLTQLSQDDPQETSDINLDLSDSKQLTNNIKENIAAEIEPTDDEYVSSSYKAVWELIKISTSEKWIMFVGLICSTLNGTNCFVYGYLFACSMAILSERDNEYIQKQARFYAICYVVLGVAIAIVLFFEAFLTGVAGEKFTMKLRSSMFKQILRQDMEWFDRPENGVGSLGARLSNDASSIQGALGLRIGIITNTTTVIAICVIIGFYYSWKLFLISITYTPFLVIALFSEKKLLAKENQIHVKVLEKSTKLAVEAISNIRTVASLSIENFILQQYGNVMNSYKRVTLKNIHLRGIAFSISRSCYPVAYLIIFYFGSALLRNNEVDVMSILIISKLVVASALTATYALAFLPNITKGLHSANQIHKLLNSEPKIKNNNQNNQKLVEGNVIYDKVCFSYPTRPNANILNDFSLDVCKGKTVALVGPSGCGKSTIIQLLERFYDSTSGKIEFGDQDITKVNLSTLRSRFGIVMQEPNLFSTTIAENIAYGNNKIVSSQDDIIKAAEMANIHAFIVSLPLGYDTKLGEKGAQLSGGQKQRISIARALIRNPEVLLLDEATSALDAESEKIVQEALNNAKKERTCIVIAHRLKTIIDADLIVVINQGDIVEMGTHNELMNKKSMYYQLCTNNQHKS